MTPPLESYLSELATLRGATRETSGYPALATLLTTIGQTLKPKVRCIIHPRNSGAGIPDGGLFTPDQLKHSDEEKPLLGVPNPARGVIEVKGAGEELDAFIESPQVKDYLAHYGQVLVTNYRDFRLLKRGPGGATLRLESFRLADSETAFWTAAAHPRKTADALGERCSEYLKRVLLHAAPLNNPKDVAFFLASYARDARARVEAAGDLPALTAVRTALEEALGMKFEADKGEHFFRSTLVQTLFYGVFSAWVLWHKENPARKDAFDWKAAGWTLHVPMIKALFHQVADPNKLRPLGLVESLDWTAAALNRVDRPAFFEQFVETHAVQYFYEPFLEAFDPALRKELGVWYTPPEIVEYMVARVDTVLREELDIPDGLADPRVFVLDPCCGTGAYVVEVLRKIHETLTERGEGVLAAADVKKAAQERIFGFELLPAPFVVAHLQLGLVLQNLGQPLDDAKNERAAIYLTNALTGWEPPTEEAKRQLTFTIPEFRQEKEAADEIKQQKRIIVILGNPPYNGYAGLAVEEERDLSTAYRTTKHAPAPQGQGLNDLYVRFFRMAERRIVEKSGEGVVCFISNYSWLDGLSFTGMRERYLEVFDGITVDCLNGDKYKTGKLTPEGAPDPSVFSTEHNREGIQVGTAIATLVKRGAGKSGQSSSKGAVLPHPSPLPLGEGTATGARRKTQRVGSNPAPDAVASAKESVAPNPARTAILPLPAGEGRGEGENVPPPTGGLSSMTNVIHFRHLWGKAKRAELLATLGQPKLYETLKPPVAVGLPFLPTKTTAAFFTWPLLPELFPVSFPGVTSGRDAELVDFDRSSLEKRLRVYFNPAVSLEEIRRVAPGLAENTGRFNAKAVRDYLCSRGYLPDNVIRFCYRPMDVRWLYWEPETKLLDEKRTDYRLQVFKGNVWIEARQRQVLHDWSRGYCTALLADSFGNGRSSFFPLLLKPNPDPSSLFERHDSDQPKANLSDAAGEYLASLRLGNQPEALFYHTLAVLHAPAYRAENSGALRQDWPRVPLPKSREALLASAELGRQVAALLDTETPVIGVTAGKVRPELVKIAVPSRLTNESLNLSLTVGWGHAGQGGVTMPGRGKLETRGYTAEEAEALGRAGCPQPAADHPDAPEPRRRGEDTAPYLLGPATHDIFLNATACWRNVPERVWDFTLGGYQVMKKWLSYREHALLGRALTPDEAREVTHMARRIAALLLLQPELDANYEVVKHDPAPWGELATG